jgi:hypothetical protein
VEIPDTPADSPLTIEDIWSSPLYRDLTTAKLDVGDPAFPFDLPRLDRPGDRARLADLNALHPVALVFGSYT